MKLINNNISQSEKENALNKLINEILERRMQPEDKYEIAAILESMGWNDSMASEAFGTDDIFALSADIWDIIQEKILFMPAAPVKKIDFMQYSIMIIRSFLRGTIFALPMAVSVASMLTLRFSLWSYEYLSLENATSIAIGTILSFMAVGGFTQAIARRGFMYLGQGHYYLARRISFYFVKSGFIVCLITSALFFLLNAIFLVYPWRMVIIVILYFIFLCAIWLSVTIMYMLQKELTFTGLILGGILVVFIFFKLANVNIILSQIISLALVSLAGVAIAYYYFMRAERGAEKGIAPPMPRLSIVAYTSIPYFAYGFLYFTFLFADRVIAWSTNNIYMPYLIWFRGEYELGLDLAIITFILPMGVVEVVVNEIMTNLEANQKNFMAANVRQMNRNYIILYIKRIIFVILFSVANAVMIYFSIKILNQNGTLETNIIANKMIRFVFIYAVIAYTVIVVALMNNMILFSLSQPEVVYRSTLYALLINVFLGFVLSRWVDYTWAVFGLLIGAIAFAIITSRRVWELFNNLDYYLYSAM
ncbi:MAG: hypothetical protein A4E55_02454 [Pelotomaculum sp. PtaU1.Bin035]|nr:MAG: hypothetical protein A4E55_02454 [Pelotomaculum sp. PtaU1.Bin035]